MKDLHNSKINTESLSKKIFDKIEGDEITPTPKWHFILKEDTLWILWMLSVCIGALGVTGSLYAFKNVGWEFYTVTHSNIFSFAVDAMPYFWIISLVVFTGVGYINIRYTKKGYKYPFTVILGSSVLASVAIGSLLFVAGAGDVIDRKIAGNIPFHKPASVFEHERWDSPEKGLLVGNVVTDEDGIYIVDSIGRNWSLSTENLFTQDFEALRKFDVVRVVGLPAMVDISTTTQSFDACFVFPWDIDDVPFGVKKEISQERKMQILIKKGDERNATSTRISICRGVRPYDSLQKIRGNIHLELDNEKITQ